jgi:hypothetical protein
MAEPLDSLRISATDAFLPRLTRHGHRAKGNGTGAGRAPGPPGPRPVPGSDEGPLKLRPPHPDRLLTAD